MFDNTPSRLESAHVQRDTTNGWYEQVNVSGSDLVIYHDENGLLTADKVSVWATKYGINSSGSGIIDGGSYNISTSYASGSNSASYAITASYSMNGGGSGVIDGGSYNISASWASQSYWTIQSLFATSSISASYSMTASVALNTALSISSSWASASLKSYYSTRSLFSTQSLFATQSINSYSSSWIPASVHIINSDTSSYWDSSSVVSLINTKQDVLTTGSTYDITSSRSINSDELFVIGSSINNNYNILMSYGMDDDQLVYAGNPAGGYQLLYNPNNGSLIGINFIGTASLAKTSSYWNSSSLVQQIILKQDIITTGSTYEITSSRATNADGIYVIGSSTNADYNLLMSYGMDDDQLVYSGKPVGGYALKYNPNNGSLIGVNFIGTASLAKTASYWNSSSLVQQIISKQDVIITGSTYEITSSRSTNSDGVYVIGSNTNNDYNIVMSYGMDDDQLLYAGKLAGGYTLKYNPNNGNLTTANFVGTASLAKTSSYWDSSSLVQQIIGKQATITTGSFFPITTSVAISSSYSTTASWSSVSSESQYSIQSISASYAKTSSFAILSSIPSVVPSASFLIYTLGISNGTASYALDALSSSYSFSSSYALTASYALTSSVEFVYSSAFANQSLFSTQSLYATQSINSYSASWVSASAFIITAQTASYITSSNIIGVVSSASYAPVEPSYSASISTIKQDTLVTGNTYQITSSFSVSASNSDTSSFILFTGKTDNYLPKWLSNNLTATSSIYDNGNNIGIGTTNPQTTLHVNGNATINNITMSNAGSNNARISSLGIVGFDTDGLLIRNSSSTSTFLDINETSLGNILIPTGKLGINTTSPVTNLQINPKISDDNGRVYDSSSLMVINENSTSGSFNDPKDVLYLGRRGASGVAYGSMATYAISRYEVGTGVSSRTRLDLDLTHDDFNDVTVMTWLSSGKVGINITNPTASLHVIGNIQATSITSSLLGTSSWATNATTANTSNAISFIPITSISASWVSASVFITTSQTASYITSSNVMGTVLSASYAPVEPVYSASVSTTKQNALVTGNLYNITSSWSQNAISASYSIVTQMTQSVGNVVSASWASSSLSSSYIAAADVIGTVRSASYAPVEPSYSASISTTKQDTLVIGDTYQITSSWSQNALTSSYPWSSNGTNTTTLQNVGISANVSDITSKLNIDGPSPLKMYNNGNGIIVQQYDTNTWGIANTGSTTKFYFPQNVGIGTTNPTTLLHVNGNATINNITMSNAGGSNARIVCAGIVGLDTSGLLIRSTDTLTTFADINYTSLGNVLFPTSKVGIGTTTPGAVLEISASGEAFPGGYTNNLKLSAKTGTAGLLFNRSATSNGMMFGLDANGLNIMSFNGATATNLVTVRETTGNVGIGTTAPGNLLQLKASSSLATHNSLRLGNTAGYAGIGTGIVWYNDGTPTFGGGALYNSGRIYSAFAANTFASAYIAIQTPTNTDTWLDTLVAKNNQVGIGGSPNQKLEVTTTANFDGLKVSGNSSKWTSIYTNLLTSNYNVLTQDGDQGIFFGAGSSDTYTNGLVIAPWSSGSRGLRLDGPTGNLTVAGNVINAANINSVYQIGGTNVVRMNNAATSLFLGNTAANISASATVAVGHGALNTLNLNTAYNTAIGSFALSSLVTGSSNVAVGGLALQNLNGTPANTYGNVSFGYFTANQLTSGATNIIIGYGAGTQLITGNDNIFIGSSAGVTGPVSASCVNSIAIGASSTVNASNKIVIGNNSHTSTKIFGALDATGSLFGNASSATNADYATTAGTATSASYAPVQPSYSASVSTILNGKQNVLITGGTYDITSSRATTADGVYVIGSNTNNDYNVLMSYGMDDDQLLYAGKSAGGYTLNYNPNNGNLTTVNFIGTASLAKTASYWNSSSIATSISGKQNTLVTGNTYNITSSWSEKCISASYAPNAGLTTGGSYPITSSWSTNTQNVNITTLINASNTGNHQFGDGSTGGIQIGDGTITKTVGSGFQVNSSITALEFDGPLVGTASCATNASNVYVISTAANDNYDVVLTMGGDAYNLIYTGYLYPLQFNPNNGTLTSRNYVGTASYTTFAASAANANTASHFKAGALENVGTSISGANDIACSTLHATSKVYGNLEGTASWATNALNAVSASYAPSSGGTITRIGTGGGAYATDWTPEGGGWYSQTITFTSVGTTNYFIGVTFDVYVAAHYMDTYTNNSCTLHVSGGTDPNYHWGLHT